MINEVFKKLEESERNYLMEAFDQLIPRWIELKDGKFIGCHCPNDDKLIVEEDNGFWFYGSIQKSK